jgi:cytochrome c
MVHCARCHGDDAIGGLMAPDVRFSVARGAVDEQSFRTVVLEGRREKGMPGFASVLNDGQVAAIYAYVAARASGKVGAGRPT